MNDVETRKLLKQPYTRILIPDEETGTFTAQILEFPGCVAQGDSPAEAYERLEEAASAWIEAAQEMQQEIPVPAADTQFGGRFALRLPRSLHRQAAQLAELDGTSLNQFLVAAIAEKVGATNLFNTLARQLLLRIVSATSSTFGAASQLSFRTAMTPGTALLSLPVLPSGRKGAH